MIHLLADFRFLHKYCFPSKFDETAPPDYFVIDPRLLGPESFRGRQLPERRMGHRGRRAFPEAVGTIQSPAPRSLVGELRSGCTVADGTTARRAGTERADHLAGLQAGLSRSPAAGKSGPDRADRICARQVQYQSGLVPERR